MPRPKGNQEGAEEGAGGLIEMEGHHGTSQSKKKSAQQRGRKGRRPKGGNASWSGNLKKILR